MKNICIVTSTRAEYGLLKILAKKVRDDDAMRLQLVVTGTHLSEKYGMTIREIIDDEMPIAEKISILDDSENPNVIFSNAVLRFGCYFRSFPPDAVVLLGDRFEILAVACACLLERIPIVHLCGGDVTFGAIDEACRHSITKMASLHFAGNETMRRRIIQMGENPGVVFNTGDTAVDNMLRVPTMNRKELAEALQFDILNNDFMLVTYHPVTTEKGKEREQIQELIFALEEIKNYRFIITKSNCDAGGDLINQYLEAFAQGKSNFLFVSSLGMKKYLSALKYCTAVVGNSSSGIVEAPLFRVPTINIGNRQEGRQQVESIINCLPKKEEIVRAIQKAVSPEHLAVTKRVECIYGDGNAAEKMYKLLKEFIVGEKINTKKRFFDVDFRLEEKK